MALFPITVPNPPAGPIVTVNLSAVGKETDQCLEAIHRVGPAAGIRCAAHVAAHVGGRDLVQQQRVAGAVRQHADLWATDGVIVGVRCDDGEGERARGIVAPDRHMHAHVPRTIMPMSVSPQGTMGTVTLACVPGMKVSVSVSNSSESPTPVRTLMPRARSFFRWPWLT